jgi:putative nucleotidyltransferase with HDIG domain
MIGRNRVGPSRQRRGFWLAVAVTGVVVLVPAAASWALVAGGLVSSVCESVVLGCVMSLLVFELGGWWWERNREAADVLFADLPVWGWLRRRALERRLADASVLFSETAQEAKRAQLRSEHPRALLRKLAADLEAADPYTHGHSRRVARYASLIARRMNLAPSQVRQIRLAAALHDVGKLHTPREILDKPAQLTDTEFAVVKLHPGDGATMIASLIDDPELIAIVRHHHERLDGNGYPDRLAGSEIPLGARIISVADTFDAITSNRAYRQSRAHKVALDIMRNEAGAQLDPDAVRAFRSAYFGRRWLWIPAAATNGGGRLLVAAATRLTETAAITASTVAVGAGAIVLPIIPAVRPSATTASQPVPSRRPSFREADRVTASRSVVTAISRPGTGHPPLGLGQPGHRISIPTSAAKPIRGTGGATNEPRGTGTGTTGPSTGVSGSGSGASGSPGAAAGPTITPTTVTLPVSSPTGVKSTVRPAPTSADATVTGSPGTTASATASPSADSITGSAAGATAGTTVATSDPTQPTTTTSP